MFHYRHPLAAAFVAVAWLTGPTQGQDCPTCGPTRSAPPGAYAAYDLAETEFGCPNSVSTCVDTFHDDPCRSEGVVFLTDVYFARIGVGAGDNIGTRLVQAAAPGTVIAGRLDPRESPSARIGAGWQTCEGLGVRARYWSLTESLGTPLTPAAAGGPNRLTHAWNWDVLDVEVTRHKLFNPIWDTSVSAGYRFASFEEGAALSAGLANRETIKGRYIGNGFTSSASVRRQFWERLSAMATGRGSMLLGTQTTTQSPGFTLPEYPVGSSFDARYVFESQIGATYEVPMRGGGLVYLRGGYEWQHWNNFVIPLGAKTDFTSINLYGAFFSLGIER